MVKRARNQTTKRRTRKPAVDRGTVREMTAEFNARVPEAKKRGLAFWWLKPHTSPFESRAAAMRMIDKLEAAMEAARASRRRRAH